MKVVSSLLIFFCVCVFCNGQEIDIIKSNFPDYDAVILEKKRILNIKLERDEVKVTKKDIKNTLIIDQQGIISHANDYVPFSNFEELGLIEASTLTEHKGKLKSFRSKDIETQTYIPNGFIYSDNKVKYVGFPNVQVGSVTRLMYPTTIIEPRFIGPFMFSDDDPVIKSEFIVNYDEGIDIGWSFYGMDTDHINVEEKMVGNQKTIIFSMDTVAVYEEEKNGPVKLEIVPHVMVYIKEYQTSQGTKVYLTSVGDLYLFYNMILKMTNYEDPYEIDTFTKHLTRNDTSVSQKIETVFQWVQKNVKYVGISEGWGGFIPEDCTDVFHKRYGDCKAMANLTSQMLKMIDINSHITWIGTTKKPYSYKDNFTPYTDNHMILTVYKNGQPQILDPTYSYGAITYPPYYLQGKEALIALTDSTYQVYEVPVMPKDQNKIVDTSYFMIVDESLAGMTKYELSGYAKNELETKLEKHTGNAEDFYTEEFNLGKNNLIANLKVEGNLDRTNYMSIEFVLKLNSHIRKFADKYYLNMNIDKSFASQSIDSKTRKYDYLFDYCSQKESVIFFTIPEGYGIEYLPENARYTGDKYGYSIEYELAGNTLRMKRLLYVDDLRIKTNEFENWNQMMDQLNLAFQEVVIIKKDE
ncbi:MAG: DUF3857 and transglutaminase domain-containing protein [Bacteroidales bacterium]|nr:DUF3857 and transglutaminase domain-containing protein [Bacteroidales bacterium]MCF8402302.1 DUF3857 and transglutaminase domain-containing protein [Bacteroidales bacterium]